MERGGGVTETELQFVECSAHASMQKSSHASLIVYVLFNLFVLQCSSFKSLFYFEVIVILHFVELGFKIKTVYTDRNDSDEEIIRTAHKKSLLSAGRALSPSSPSSFSSSSLRSGTQRLSMTPACCQVGDSSDSHSSHTD